MDSVDPETLLEWLQNGVGEGRDIQLMALEQLCMLLLMSDNIDQCFESCPPRTFLPALCKIFLDETAPENVLEVTARAITYYLDVSNECTRRITQVDGAVKAICNRLAVAEMAQRTSKDLAEQCVKLLEHICQREPTAVFDSGGLHCMLTLVRQHGQCVHKDTVHSAMSVVTRLCGKVEPTDSSLLECSGNLGALLEHEDPKVSECALRCFAALTDRFIRKGMDPVNMARRGNLVEHLLNSLLPTHLGNFSSTASLSSYMAKVNSSGSLISCESASSSPAVGASHRPTSFISVVMSLLCNLCRGSSAVTEQVVSSPQLILALKNVLSSKDERCVIDALRLCDLIVILLCEGRSALPKNSGNVALAKSEPGVQAIRTNRHLIDAIRQRDADTLIDAVESGQVDVNFTDDVGQTLLNWSSAFGTPEMVKYLCEKGADVNKGHRSSSLHYAACFGRADIVKQLLKYGANPDLRDEEGKTALDKAHERSEEGHQQVARILESPGPYMHKAEEETSNSMKIDVKETLTEDLDPVVVNDLLEQLLPLLCDVFQRSLGAGIHRSSLSILRKTVSHLSAESLHSLINWEGNAAETRLDSSFTYGKRLAENLVNVLMAGLDLEEDMDAQESVLLTIKSLFIKEADFWLDQLARIGIFEKVEALAKQTYSGGTVADSESYFGPSHSAYKSTPTSHKDRTDESPCTQLGKSGEDLGIAGMRSGQPSGNVRHIYLEVPLGVSDETSEEGNVVTTTPPTIADSSSSAGHQKADAFTSVVRLSPGSDSPIAITATPFSDKFELEYEKCYRWNDWRLIRSRDSFFVWCDAVAIEFSDGSNGWFRFLMDGQLNTMYSSGCPEEGTDNAEVRGEFVDKLAKARNAVPAGSALNPIFSTPELDRTIEIANWTVQSHKPGELVIVNREGNQQRVVITEDMPGFVFESSQQTKHSFQAERTLGLDFVTGWAARGGGRRLRFRTETQKMKIRELAGEIWEKHMKEAKAKPRDDLVTLQNATSQLQEVCETDLSKPSWELIYQIEKSLKCFHGAVVNDHLSTFELSVSGIVDAALHLLEHVRTYPTSELSQTFKRVFADYRSLFAFIRKMVSILEVVEKFPQYLFDVPGGSAFGLQLLNRRIKLKLLQLGADTHAENNLLNRSGSTMKIEPLATVKQLKEYIQRMVKKQWYDYPRETFEYVKQILVTKKEGKRVSFNYSKDFDENGIIYWLGTNGRTSSDWLNPAAIGVIRISCSDGDRLPYGRLEDILSRDTNALNCHTSDDRDAHFTVDFGLLLLPTFYTLRHARGYGKSALRNWSLQGSLDAVTWDTLMTHENDTTLTHPGSTGTWQCNAHGKGPFRYLRIAQNGKNSSTQSHYLSLSGFEVYGHVYDVILDDFKIAEDKMKQTKRADRAGGNIAHHDSAHAEMPPAAFASMKNAPGINIHGQLPCGALNNKVVSGAVRFDSSLRRIISSRRNLKASPSNLPGSAVGLGRSKPVLSETTLTCQNGNRVGRGPDWMWGNQGSGCDGTIISRTEDGWVDVRWDDHYVNSYRFGAEGKYDVEIKPHDTKNASNAARNRREYAAIGFVPTPVRQLPPASRGTNAHNSVGFSRKTRIQPFSRYHQNAYARNMMEVARSTENNGLCIRCGSKDHETRECLSTPIECISPIQKLNSAEGSATNKAPASNPSCSTIAQKSMSTTNLSESTEADRRMSVASTNQAASAESLQHQTPSLENLLARSKIFDDRIPEVVTDEQMPNLETPETNSSSIVVDTDHESISTNNNIRYDALYESFDDTSLATPQPEADISLRQTHTDVLPVSSMAKGSQPALAEKHQGTVAGEQGQVEGPDKLETTSSEAGFSSRIGRTLTLEEANAKNLANLSISTPELVVLRPRRTPAAAGSNASSGVSDENDFVRTFLRELGIGNDSLRTLKEILTTGESLPVGDEKDGEGSNAANDVRGTDLQSSSGLQTYAAPRIEDASNKASSSTPCPGMSMFTGHGKRFITLRQLASSATGTRRTSLRSRYSNYPDVIRNVVMQEIIDGSGPFSNLELDELEDEIDDDDLQDDGNEDDGEDDFASGLSAETLAQAAAALRRQSSGGTASATLEQKLSWKQIMMNEASRLISDRNLRESLEERQANSRTSRVWDDEYLLKQKLNDLIPAFDPRPGRTNVNQIQDIELPPESGNEEPESGSSAAAARKELSETSNLRMYICGPNLANVKNVTVEMVKDDDCIFSYIQQLVQSVDWGNKSERTKRVWEPTYTLFYGDISDRTNLPSTVNKKVEAMNRTPDNVAQVLSVLLKLHGYCESNEDVEINSEVFVSEKLTQKLIQELSDPLIVSSRAIPSWCTELLYHYPFLFTVDTRTLYFRATAFGTSRSIVWLQTRRDQVMEQTRGAASSVAVSNVAGARREDHYPEFRIGRIKHERVKVPRNDAELFAYANRLMEYHASMKSILEVQYIDEEGTGLGPTLEFYALVAAEFQRKDFQMWICDDTVDSDHMEDIDLGEGVKPPGYYVRRAGGLFPAPIPCSSEELKHVSDKFRTLGIFIAKVLQDSRIVDLPLSKPFLKLMLDSRFIEGNSLAGILTLDDLELVLPLKGRVLKDLSVLVANKQSIESQMEMEPYTKRRRIEELKLHVNNTECAIEDLALTFCVNPPSSVFGYKQVELVEDGANVDVTLENIDLYIEKCMDFYLNSGIENQLIAFRDGFDRVFPLQNLRLFTPEEVQVLLSGDQCPEWTREDIINFTEPKLGYTKEAPGFLRFVDVLVGMSASERKSFLQFTTGCSSLPPGGLANLHPRLTVVRKVDSGDGSYPSVNTCVHYLKLPDYSSTQIMRERLLAATIEKGFHLN